MNSFPKDTVNSLIDRQEESQLDIGLLESCRLPVVVHYQPDGSPYLWHFSRRCRINLPLSTQTQTTSVSLELVSISADKATVSSGSDEVPRAELAVQTETESVSLNLFTTNSGKMFISDGPVQVSFVDQSVQSHLLLRFEHPDVLSVSQSDISE